MIKKVTAVISVLLILCLTITANAEGYGELPPEQDCYLIHDAAELAGIADYPEGNYRLVCDIDMSGVEWTPLDFFGTLDGNGYAILNLKVRSVGGLVATTTDGNWKEYDSCFAGLFSYMEGAGIHDLSILGADIAIESDSSCFCGVLSGCMRDSTVENCAFSGRVSLTQSAVMCGVGGISGYGCGCITGCSADVDLILTDTNTGVDCEEFAGGVIGCGHPDILDCTVNADIYASVHGYCHNGGLVGMHHVDVHENVYTSVIGNTVSGSISFFEHVRSRRAYADPIIGETMNPIIKVRENTSDFAINETKDYSQNIYPCTCEVSKTENIISGNCTDYGYTEHVCTDCGYTWRDTYTLRVHSPGEWQVKVDATLTEAGTAVLYCALCGELMEEKEIPPHTPGEWTVTADASYTESGIESRFCTDCGALIETRTLAPHVAGDWVIEQEPTYYHEGIKVRFCTDCGVKLEEAPVQKLIFADSCIVSSEELCLNYRTDALLTAEVMPAEAADHSITWVSSDERVANVDSSGRVTASGRGSAVITCISGDGKAFGQCAVTVNYTWWQWLIVIFAFGWIWY